ncbi:hypothetical protein QLL95_gp1184 [Cotonvirus japonicus]|uniref:Uncharacterized protein n=1 Tax=Cotonvirus japonicus TaxID=2811091 RepID=A0ABM7NS12_9VIRU|nr:hypothetical protein QLL95_gp1184 [Cotonvirus japonicus]BCS82939.1 hypothetical protein [Cotonvirus japonicus]
MKQSNKFSNITSKKLMQNTQSDAQSNTQSNVKLKPKYSIVSPDNFAIKSLIDDLVLMRCTNDMILPKYPARHACSLFLENKSCFKSAFYRHKPPKLPSQKNRGFRKKKSNQMRSQISKQRQTHPILF